MKKVYVVYSCDCNHTKNSYSLQGIFSNKEIAIDVIHEIAENTDTEEAGNQPISKDDLYLLNTYHQTQARNENYIIDEVTIGSYFLNGMEQNAEPPAPTGLLAQRTPADIWREYNNDFMTVEKMADYYQQQDIKSLKVIINAGRLQHNKLTAAAPYYENKSRLVWEKGDSEYYIFKTSYIEKGVVYCVLESPIGNIINEVPATELKKQ